MSQYSDRMTALESRLAGYQESIGRNARPRRATEPEPPKAPSVADAEKPAPEKAAAKSFEPVETGRRLDLSPDGANRSGTGDHAARGRGPQARPYDEMIRYASAVYGVDPDLVRAVVKAESNFNPNSTSPKGAMGLMQLMPETAKEVAGRRNIALSSDPAVLYDEALNVRLGVWYVRQLLDRLQHAAPVAAAYNAGQSQSVYWSRLSGKPLDYYFIPEVHFAQTREYVNLVLANRSMYAWLYPELAAAAAPPPAK